MNVFALEASSWPEAEKSGVNKRNTVAAVKKGLDVCKNLLPMLSGSLNIAIRPYFQGIIPEYGSGARTWDSEFIEIWIDKTVPYGAEKMLESIYQATLHECNHAARWNSIGEDNRIIESAIFEGLATVFERNYAKFQPLYANYENDAQMLSWYEEIFAAGSDWSKRDELFFYHSDGRRWIAYKTGTWIVDKASRNSGKIVTDLTIMSADEIIKLAGLSD